MEQSKVDKNNCETNACKKCPTLRLYDFKHTNRVGICYLLVPWKIPYPATKFGLRISGEFLCLQIADHTYWKCIYIYIYTLYIYIYWVFFLTYIYIYGSIIHPFHIHSLTLEVPPSTSTSSRCRSNSAFRAQGFTDEEIVAW